MNFINIKIMKQLTYEQAWLLFVSNVWKDWTAEDLVFFQLWQRNIGVGYDEFMAALKETTGKTKWTTKDFCQPHMEETRVLFLKKTKRTPPELAYFRKLIPREKRILIFHTEALQANHELNKLKSANDTHKVKRTKTPKRSKFKRTR